MRSTGGLALIVAIVCMLLSCSGGGDDRTLVVTISPKNPTVFVGGQLQFTATVTNTSDTSVTWSASSGHIDQTGLFSAPLSEGAVQVKATSNADPGKSAATQVAVTVVSVEVLPATAALRPSDVVQFSAAVTGAANTSVTWSASSGSIDQTGRFTAPGAPGPVDVVATSQADPTKQGHAQVAVGTVLTANILTDTLLTKSGSPYFVDSPITIYNATLTVEPGVEIRGSLVLRGTSTRFVALGTPEEPIAFVGSGITMPEYLTTLDPAPTVQLSYCSVTGGPLGGYGNVSVDHSAIDLASYNGLSIGRGAVTDSRVTFRGGGYLQGRGGSLARNVFTFDVPYYNIFLRLAMASWTQIVNNVFQSPQSSTNVLFLVTNPESVQELKGNSFLIGDGAITVDGTSGFGQPTSPVTMDWSGNYWGTTDLAAIRRKIAVDATTAPWLMTTIGVEPFLASPDPLTPVP